MCANNKLPSRTPTTEEYRGGGGGGGGAGRGRLAHWILQIGVTPSNYNQDNSLNIRVYSDESPSPDFISVQPQLDDVYFITLKSDEPVLA